MITAASLIKEKAGSNHILIILLSFAVSRFIIYLLDIHLDYSTLYSYWQYLDVTTLQQGLLKGVWYDHTQPPAFNLFLGIVLKITGEVYAPIVFAFLLKLISLANTLLIYLLVKRLTHHPYVALFMALAYLLSPGTIAFENELFYTSFISLFFLISAYHLSCFTESIRWRHAIGFFIPLVVICFTRSMYHLLLLLVITIVVYLLNRGKKGTGKLLTVAVISLLLCGSWYAKNYVVFGKFSTSSWIGMNIARNIFHDNEITDSSRIESVEPFQPISAYSAYIKHDLTAKYTGLNDRDLLQEMKNDSFRNEKHINFLEVSDLYMAAGKKRIKENPAAFVKNVVQSAIIFFAPATRYSGTEQQVKKIKYYDAVYSFNLSQFVTGKQARRIALTLSAIPYVLLYLFTYWVLIGEALRKKKMTTLNGFIILVTGYVFFAGSLLEHYENMRFRYELQPLFLLLFSQAIIIFIDKKKKSVA